MLCWLQVNCSWFNKPVLLPIGRGFYFLRNLNCTCCLQLGIGIPILKRSQFCFHNSWSIQKWKWIPFISRKVKAVIRASKNFFGFPFTWGNHGILYLQWPRFEQRFFLGLTCEGGKKLNSPNGRLELGSLTRNPTQTTNYAPLWLVKSKFKFQ